MMSLRNHAQNRQSGERLLSEMPSLFVGLIFVATVLFFQPFALDQFVLPKVVVVLVFAPLVVGLMFAGRPPIIGDGVLIGLVVAVVLSSIFVPLVQAQNRLLHGIGVLEILAGVVLFLGVLGVRAGGERSEVRLIRLLALPALIVAPLAVGQGLGFDPLRMLFDLSSTRPGRWQVLTTLGNPTWTAELLVLSLPLVLAACKTCGRWRGVLVAVVSVILTVAVGVTGSRGAVVGFALAAALCWRLGLFPRRVNGRWVAAFGALAIAVLVGLIGVARIGELKPLTGRLGLWMAGLHLVGQEPLTGSGLRHTSLVLAEGLESVVGQLDEKHQPWLPTVLVDRLDQDFLQVAVERGLPAALFLVLVWWRAFVVAFKRFRKDREAGDAAAIAVLAVMAVLSLFSAPLHTPATASLFWIVLGLAAAGPRREYQREKRGESFWPLLTVIVSAGLVTVMVVLVALPLLSSNAEAGLGHRFLIEGRYQEAADTLRPVVYDSPWLTGASIDCSRALVAKGQAAEALVFLAEVELWTRSQWIWATRARALDQLGLRVEAGRELARGFRVLPRSPVLLEAQSELELVRPSHQ